MVTLALALVLADLLLVFCIYFVFMRERLEERQHQVDLMQAKMDGFKAVLDEEFVFLIDQVQDKIKINTYKKYHEEIQLFRYVHCYSVF